MRPGVAVGLALVAAIVLMLSTRGCLFASPLTSNWRGWGNWDPLWGTGLFGIGWMLFAALAVWVGVDAHRRGSNGFLWGLFVFFAPVIGLVVYLILVTTREGNGAPGVSVQWQQKQPCSSCGTAIQAEFKICPYCGHSQGCTGCGQRVEVGWKVCPHCGAGIDRGSTNPPAPPPT
jgi:RNA polymerase subunit RPABC4/transcription elongation factor Spt4